MLISRHRIALFALAAVPGTIVTDAVQAPCTYEVEIMQAPPCPPPFNYTPATFGTGINDYGDVVGYYHQCGGAEGDEAFVWSPGAGLVTLPRPPGVSSANAADVNDAFQIVGTMLLSSGYRAFLYEQGAFLDLGL